MASRIRNVIHFLADEALNGLYSGRTEKYLQPELVHVSAFADDAKEFEEITRPGSNWYLLVVDAARANNASAVIERFRARHPNCSIVVLQEPAGSTPGLRGVNIIDSPRDLDDWLVAMRRLLK